MAARAGAAPSGKAKPSTGRKAKASTAKASTAATPMGSAENGAAARPDLTALIRAIPKRLPSSIKLTNLEKVLYPEQGLSKAAIVAYYAAVCDRMLPLCADRPLMLLRCPEGRHKDCFVQKHVGRGMPDVLHQVPIDEGGEVHQYMALDSFDGLVALAQMGVLEIHTWGAHRDKIERPDLLVMDLDPDESLPWQAVRDAALELRGRLADLSLESFVKTTGGKGLHVVAPVERRLEWDDFKAFAQALALVNGARPARPLRRHDDEEQARREDLRRLPAQRSRLHGDRGVLDAGAAERTGRRADHLGRAGGRRLALRLHRADNAGPAAATAPRPVARFRRHAPVDHRGDAPRARAAPPLSAARYPAVVAPPSRPSTSPVT